MDKIGKWEASHEQTSQMVMPSQEQQEPEQVLELALMQSRKHLGVDLKEKVFV